MNPQIRIIDVVPTYTYSCQGCRIEIVLDKPVDIIPITQPLCSKCQYKKEKWDKMHASGLGNPASETSVTKLTPIGTESSKNEKTKDFGR